MEHELIGTNAHVCDLDMPTALELLASRAQPWSDIAPIAISLDQVVIEGLEPMVQRHARRIKTLIDPWASGSRPTNMVVGT